MKRVLLVDDDLDILEAMSAVLEETYEVLVARNGALALRILEEQGPAVHAVVLDLMMPVMDGAAFMHEYHLRGMTTPVIIASAGTGLERRRQELGATACLAKPFDVPALEKRLQEAVG